MGHVMDTKRFDMFVTLGGAIDWGLEQEGLCWLNAFKTENMFESLLVDFERRR